MHASPTLPAAAEPSPLTGCWRHTALDAPVVHAAYSLVLLHPASLAQHDAAPLARLGHQRACIGASGKRHNLHLVAAVGEQRTGGQRGGESAVSLQGCLSTMAPHQATWRCEAPAGAPAGGQRQGSCDKGHHFAAMVARGQLLKPHVGSTPSHRKDKPSRTPSHLCLGLPSFTLCTPSTSTRCSLGRPVCRAVPMQCSSTSPR